MESLEKLKLIYEAALDKKAQEPSALYVENLARVADYFLICTALNPIHARAIADSVLEKMAEHHENPLRIEGTRGNSWILIDMGEVVAHIMFKEAREYYLLEKLWGDAPKVELEI
ncbi:MAG: ribosome silencing factor [Bacillota bacterium]